MNLTAAVASAMRYTAPLPIVLALAGCAALEDEAERGYAHNTLTIPVAFTTADVRVITERRHPVTGQTVICTEPSPDVAKALSAAVGGGAQGGNGTVTGSGNFGAVSAETAAELAGRSTALIGLRDGLFQACQAYANGAIGADAYALIISRYGQLMTTLFLGQDVIGAAGTQGGTPFSSPPVSLTVSGNGNSVNASTNGGSTSGSGSGSGTGSSSGTGSGAGTRSGSGSGSGSGTGSSAGGATSDSGDAPNRNSTTGSSVTASTGSSTQATAQPSAAANALPSAAAVLSLARMNEDYFNLDYNLMHTLAVVCINQGDPTIVVAPDPNQVARGAQFRQANPWLLNVCNQLGTLLTTQQGITALATIPQELTKAKVLSPPINPEVAAQAIATAESKKIKTTTTKTMVKANAASAKCVTMTYTQLEAVQTALIQSGELKKDAFDPSNNLPEAILKYESDKGLPGGYCKVGQIAQKTLDALIAPKPKAAHR